MNVYFASSNRNKRKEVKKILSSKKINVLTYNLKDPIKELQSNDLEEIVIDKVLKAFDKIRRPVIVEHTALYLKEMKGFPGGLTQIFWDTLEAKVFCKYCCNMHVTAMTIVAFCDGKIIKLFNGKIKGRIADVPSKNRTFEWDCVFIPNGQKKTFAEMSKKKKNSISMRKKALKQLKEYLEDNYVTV